MIHGASYYSTVCKCQAFISEFKKEGGNCEGITGLFGIQNHTTRLKDLALVWSIEIETSLLIKKTPRRIKPGYSIETPGFYMSNNNPVCMIGNVDHP